MISRTVSVTVVGLALTGAVGVARQHEGHQAAEAGGSAPAAIAQCAQAQPAVVAALDAADARLEGARQTNSPAAMRAAIDDLQGALRDVRARLAPCAAPRPVADPPAGRQAPPVASPAADPHAGHTMPAPAESRQAQP
ncbi:MAG: hypothetical protein HY824_16360 [Acidobacteria bacterium]|nr:hypothetical protein [Acidobacteriota bacterium]